MGGVGRAVRFVTDCAIAVFKVNSAQSDAMPQMVFAIFIYWRGILMAEAYMSKDS